MKQILGAFSVIVFLLTLPQGLYSAVDTEGSITASPVRQAIVSGDAHKFREQNWMKEDYSGGIEDWDFKIKEIPQDITVTSEGHAIIADNDYDAKVRVEKNEFAYTQFEFEEFSKFYDDSGGVYYPFKTYTAPTLNKELELEMGKLRVETGLIIPDKPQIMFAYERHYKDGEKSRLTWGAVTEGSTTRNIAPSYQEVEEIVDSVELAEQWDVKGFDLRGEQKWEWTESELNRHEYSYSTNSTASQKKMRDQIQEPEAKMFTTTESVSRWFKDETIFGGLAYNFVNLDSQELENIFEYNENRVLTNFSNPKAIRNASADNEYDSHAWVANFMAEPLSWLNVGTKVRTELTERSGNSSYPSDSTPAAAGGSAPDGVINTTEISRVDDKVGKIGEALSFRFTAIPKTALYNEFELEQVRNWLSEDRDSIPGQSVANTNEIFGRETITYVNRGVWTIGGQTEPCRYVNLNGNFRIIQNNSDYDDKRETQPGATAAKSAFFDELQTETHEFATHATFKPKPWLRPSVRYRYQIRDYISRVEDETDIETEMDTHIFTFDASVQPTDNLMFMAGVSPQYATILNPYSSNLSSVGGAPKFKANLFSWFFNTEYDINDALSLLSSIEYSGAENYDDFTATGLPLGVSFNQTNLSFGVKWRVSPLMSIGLDYDFFHYAGDSRVELSDYNANVISLKTTLNWA